MADVLAPVGTLRIVAGRLTIGGFSLAALLGIVALAAGGAFGSVEGRILLTTLLVGTLSVLVLCCLLTAGTKYQPVGVTGAAVALVPLVSALLLIWYDYESDVPAALARTFGVGAIAAATLAQASLLLALVCAAGAALRRLALTAVALAGVLAVQLCAVVLGLDPHQSYLRVVGVVAILDVFATVLVAALTGFGAAIRRPPAFAALSLPSALVARAGERALATGQSTEDVVAAAVEAYLVEAPVP